MDSHTFYDYEKEDKTYIVKHCFNLEAEYVKVGNTADRQGEHIKVHEERKGLADRTIYNQGRE